MTQVTGRDWAADVTSRIGTRVRYARRRKGWTAVGLSVRCTELGYPLTPSVLLNIESGKKRELTIHDVVIIARALGVFPAWLLYGGESEVFLTPDEVCTGDNATAWFGGTAEPGDTAKYATMAYTDVIAARDALTEAIIKTFTTLAPRTDPTNDPHDLFAAETHRDTARHNGHHTPPPDTHNRQPLTGETPPTHTHR